MEQKIEGKAEKEKNGFLILKLYTICSSPPLRIIEIYNPSIKVWRIRENWYRMDIKEEGYEDQVEFGFCYKGENKGDKTETVKNFFYNKIRKLKETNLDISPFLREGYYHVKGYVNSWKQDEKVLTNWIEKEENGELYVFDVLKNLIMRKEDYYRVFAPDVLEIYKKEEIRNEHKTK